MLWFENGSRPEMESRMRPLDFCVTESSNKEVAARIGARDKLPGPLLRGSNVGPFQKHVENGKRKKFLGGPFDP